jgi:hypothetical protein
MDVFELRRRLVHGYRDYVGSFIRVRDARLREFVTRALDEGRL